jgi:hypothetical protein
MLSEKNSVAQMIVVGMWVCYVEYMNTVYRIGKYQRKGQAVRQHSW